MLNRCRRLTEIREEYLCPETTSPELHGWKATALDYTQSPHLGTDHQVKISIAFLLFTVSFGLNMAIGSLVLIRLS
jgi:hypothetical protein